MAELSTCPDASVFERLLAGNVWPDEADALEQHLAFCARCQTCLTQVDVSDPLLDRLRGSDAVAAQLPQGAVLEVLMRRLRDAPPPGIGEPDSVAGTPLLQNETLTVEPAPDFADLLGPPRGPGELGCLGPYRVIKVLGTGGMGVVFQAEDPQLERSIALKVLNANWATNPTARKRFQREARATAALEHDHIVPVYHVGEENGVFFLVMPLLRGESLDARLKRQGRLPVAEAMRIARETAVGLAAAHNCRLVHRDIKPANIWLESGGDTSLAPRVKILDFGLARTADNAEVTQRGVVIGTPAYMAPEQARGETVDHRADLFSLGCVLYQMCTGEVPFKGRDVLSTLTALAVDRPRPPCDLNPEVPAALSDLVMALLARIPSERPASAEAVVKALQAIEAIEHEQSLLGDRPATPGGKQTARNGPSSASSRRYRVILAVAATVLLTGLGLTGYHLGPAVIRIATNRGELIIETVDKDVEVAVKQAGELVEIIDLKTKQKIELKAGDYEVALSGKADGLRLSAKKFTLNRGGTKIVAVEWLKKDEKEPPAGEAEAFVLLDSKGAAMRKVGTLAEAVVAANDGDTIEVRGNGPFVTDPIKITQAALTIRSGAGFRPAIKLRSEAVEAKARLLETTGDLVVEGLEFQRMARDEQFAFSPWPALLQASKALHVANCRFITTKTRSAIQSDGAVCVVRNCELLCSECGFSVHMSPWTPVKSLVVDNCVATQSAQITFWTVGAKESPVRLSRNTWRAEMGPLAEMGPFWFQTWKPDRPEDTVKPPDKGVKVLRVEASGNVFDGGSVFYWHCGPNQVFPENLLPKLVSWKGEGNVFAGAGPLIELQRGKAAPEPVKGTQTLADWRRFWGTVEANSIRGIVRYQGGDLDSKARLTPDQLTPEDFRLRADSAGYRAGKDGKDLGADVDLVGPGKAYERWKKTPQYQEWLKETGQLRANAGSPPQIRNGLGMESVPVPNGDTLHIVRLAEVQP
jgi:serine/threonine protein kinase